jgi:hypothetical protein
MVTKGGEPDVDNFLAYWFELHRMRDGEPRRLFFEDHWGLFRALGTFGYADDDFGFAHDVFIRSVVIFNKKTA